MKHLKRFNENISLEDDIVLVFSDLEDNGFKVKYNQEEQEIMLLRWKREPFEWNDISDKLHLYEEHIQDEHKGARLSYLTEAYYLTEGGQKKGFWYPHNPFDDVWNIYVNDTDIKIKRDDVKIVSIAIFTEF